jgi:hypothetical protein
MQGARGRFRLLTFFSVVWILAPPQIYACFRLRIILITCPSFLYSWSGLLHPSNYQARIASPSLLDLYPGQRALPNYIHRLALPISLDSSQLSVSHSLVKPLDLYPECLPLHKLLISFDFSGILIYVSPTYLRIISPGSPHWIYNLASCLSDCSYYTYHASFLLSIPHLVTYVQSPFLLIASASSKSLILSFLSDLNHDILTSPRLMRS